MSRVHRYAVKCAALPLDISKYLVYTMYAGRPKLYLYIESLHMIYASLTHAVSLSVTEPQAPLHYTRVLEGATVPYCATLSSPAEVSSYGRGVKPADCYAVRTTPFSYLEGKVCNAGHDTGYKTLATAAIPPDPNPDLEDYIEDNWQEAMDATQRSFALFSFVHLPLVDRAYCYALWRQAVEVSVKIRRESLDAILALCSADDHAHVVNTAYWVPSFSLLGRATMTLTAQRLHSGLLETIRLALTVHDSANGIFVYKCDVPAQNPLFSKREQ